jgi:hypothetical protein
VLCAASSKDQVEQDKFTKWPIKREKMDEKKQREQGRRAENTNKMQ